MRLYKNTLNVVATVDEILYYRMNMNGLALHAGTT